MPMPSTPLTDNEKWHAVSTRDAAADGRFIYGVRTTRIYCRPNCKARLARRANVVYFGDARAAEAAGFRACKRCKPAAVGGMPEDAAVARIRSLVAAADADADAGSHSENPEQKRGAARLATEARVSRWHFHRKFKEVTGMTPRAYLQKRASDARARDQASGSAESAASTESATPLSSVSASASASASASVSARADHLPESPAAVPVLSPDQLPGWLDFDFGALLSLPDDAPADWPSPSPFGADMLDGDDMASFEDYLDGIDPCLLQPR